MVQALKKGEIDYARDVPADAVRRAQDRPGRRDRDAEGESNGWTELAFNMLRRQDDQGRWRVDDGAPGPGLPRRARLRHRQAGARRPRRLSGYGTLGTPRSRRSRRAGTSSPNDIRDVRHRRRPRPKLDAAGYKLDASGKRLDKEGKPISLRLVLPDATRSTPRPPSSSSTGSASSGSRSTRPRRTRPSSATELLPPEADPPGKADYDMFIWDWVGDPDPTSLLKVFTTEAIGGSSATASGRTRSTTSCTTSSWPRRTARAAKRIVAQMQQTHVRPGAVPHPVLPTQAHAYRTDKFGGWQNQPRRTERRSSATAPLDYTYLTDANAPAPSPSAVGRGVVGAGRVRGGGRVGPGARPRPRHRHPCPPTRAAPARRSC